MTTFSAFNVLKALALRAIRSRGISCAISHLHNKDPCDHIPSTSYYNHLLQLARLPTWYVGLQLRYQCQLTRISCPPLFQGVWTAKRSHHRCLEMTTFRSCRQRLSNLTSPKLGCAWEWSGRVVSWAPPRWASCATPAVQEMLASLAYGHMINNVRKRTVKKHNFTCNQPIINKPITNLAPKLDMEGGGRAGDSWKEKLRSSMALCWNL